MSEFDIFAGGVIDVSTETKKQKPKLDVYDGFALGVLGNIVASFIGTHSTTDDVTDDVTADDVTVTADATDDVTVTADATDDASQFNIFSGGAVTYDADAVIRDEIISDMLPEKIGECLIAPNGHCMSAPTLSKVASIVGASNDKAIEVAKEKLGCDTEICVLKKLEPELGPQQVHAELTTHFKLEGPTDNKWLSNYNVDGVMKQFAAKFPGFYPYNFHMANFSEYSFHDGRVKAEPDTLHTTPVVSLLQKYKTFGCIINTGTYQSRGEHWMALFVDTRNIPYTIEFFNSSGGGPRSYAKWLSSTQNDLSTIAPTEIVRCDVIRHQQSMSECGLYSLFYIYSRLNGVPYSYFQSVPIPDKFMFEFRNHLFDDGKGPAAGTEFSWEEYQKAVSIKWE
jgi:hypothetical protein